jgi:hypothetical protein
MPVLCDKCEKDMNNAIPVICYGGCQKQFHFECAGLSRTSVKYLSEVSNLKWFCDACIQGHDLLFKMDKKLSDLNEMFASIDKKIEKHEALMQTSISKIDCSIIKQNESNDQIKNSILHVNDDVNKKKTFADVLKRNVDGPVVVIKPKNSEQKSDATQKFIKEKIDPVDVPINILRSVSRGSVVVQCHDKDGIEECKKKIEEQLGENYSVSVPESKNPMVKIVGLSEITSEDILIKRIKSQNNFISSEAKIEVVELKQKNNKIFASVKCDGDTFGKIMNSGRIIVGWDRCRVYEHFQIVRCFKCSGYRHIAKECRHEVACPKCAGAHELSKCESREIKCINCITTNKNLNLNFDVLHSAWHRDCPVFVRKINTEMKKIEYAK